MSGSGDGLGSDGGLRDLGESAIEGLLERVGRGVSKVQERRPLAYDLLESEEAYLAVFDAPGTTNSDIQVQFREDAVKVKVDRFREFHEEFEMRFPGRGLSLDGTAELPEDASVDPTAAEATLAENGTLRVRIPKEEDDGPVDVAEEDEQTEQDDGPESIELDEHGDADEHDEGDGHDESETDEHDEGDGHDEGETDEHDEGETDEHDEGETDEHDEGDGHDEGETNGHGDDEHAGDHDDQTDADDTHADADGNAHDAGDHEEHADAHDGHEEHADDESEN